jgi:hypothetical protein
LEEMIAVKVCSELHMHGISSEPRYFGNNSLYSCGFVTYHVLIKPHGTLGGIISRIMVCVVECHCCY